jgi:hypothetical protein
VCTSAWQSDPAHIQPEGEAAAHAVERAQEGHLHLQSGLCHNALKREIGRSTLSPSSERAHLEISRSCGGVKRSCGGVKRSCGGALL